MLSPALFVMGQCCSVQRICHCKSSVICRAPRALINTCIRHARSNLGIDLSSCRQWMRFLEVHYQRPASTMTPSAMETSEVRATLFACSSMAFSILRFPIYSWPFFKDQGSHPVVM